jgi:Protein of unknown function (DUF2934)
MAKRTTKKSSSSTQTASAPGAEHGTVPVEQATKAVENTTSMKGRQEDVRSSADMPSLNRDMVAQRAYEIWATEGGSDLENWLKAEAELRTKNTQQGQWR